MALLVQACAIAPGMTMREPAELPECVDCEDDAVIRVQPITIDLLAQMEVDRASDVKEVAEEFSVEPQSYMVGVGDVLQIIVWEHPELTIPAGSFRDAETSGQIVGDDGYLFYPYVWRVLFLSASGALVMYSN